jgi:uncharacterized protein
MTSQRIRDPLHNLIEFNQNDRFERVMWDVLQTQPFQRLRRIKQLGFSEFVYPGATHTRLAHSLGVFHTARHLEKIVREKNSAEYDDAKAKEALAAALVHDLGHGPFSHAFETVGKKLGLKMAKHEHVSDLLIREGEVAKVLKKRGSGFANDVADVVKGTGAKTIYSAIVSSQFDADRLDYMQRDRLMTGTHHAAIDYQWLLANLEIDSVPFGVDGTKVAEVQTFVLGPKAIYNAEAYVLGLFQLYPTIYFHKTTRGVENIFKEILIRVFEYGQANEETVLNLPTNHPLVKFAKNPESVDRVIELDDAVVWGALSMLADSSDPLVSLYSKRLRDRQLLKCVDIRNEISARLPKEEMGRLDEICIALKEKLIDVSERRKNKIPLILVDDGKRSPYKHVDESTSLLERINIRTPTGLSDLADVSEVVAAVKPYQFLRAYIDRDDEAVKLELMEMIKAEVKL